MTMPGLALILGGISLVAGLVAVQPISIVLGLLVVLVALHQGSAP